MTKQITMKDGCYHTSEFVNLPERCDLPAKGDLPKGCHKGHLWIVDGKKQYHAPDATKIQLVRSISS